MEHLTQVSIMYFDGPNKRYNYWKSTKTPSNSIHDFIIPKVSATNHMQLFFMNTNFQILQG